MPPYVYNARPRYPGQISCGQTGNRIVSEYSVAPCRKCLSVEVSSLKHIIRSGIESKNPRHLESGGLNFKADIENT
jgi:hypothetical protein